MTAWKLAWRSLLYYWRTNLGVMLGCATACAVLVGALLVGDSVDYTLRRLAQVRLGQVALAVDRGHGFFGASLAERMAASLGHPAAAVLALPGMALAGDDADALPRQVNRISVLGVTPAFWDLALESVPDLAEGEAALSARLARELGVAGGDELSIRVVRPGLLPRDAPLAARTDEVTVRLRVRVASVLPDESMGRFDLRPGQVAPYNLMVPLAWLQGHAGLEDEANLLLLGGPGDEEAERAARMALREVWTLADGGLEVVEPVPGIFQLEARRIFLPESVASAVLREPGSSGALTYFVTLLHNEQRPEYSTPYSFVNAVAVPRKGDPGSGASDGFRANELQGRVTAAELQAVLQDMGPEEIVLNDWTAGQLQVEPGDKVRMTYMLPTAANEYSEHERVFGVRAVLPMEVFAVERSMMPSFPGLSDVDSCRGWDIGLPLEDELLADEANEAYWQAYRDTPKALVTLDAGRELWPLRYGPLTAVRLPSRGRDKADVAAVWRAHLDPAHTGLEVLPVQRQAREAVSQAMDFGQLFLGMSFFLLGAALLLTVLLFLLGVDQRRRQTGLLKALGWGRLRVLEIHAFEAAVLAAAGCALGGLAGRGYTRALLWGLGRFWQDSAPGIEIRFHAAPVTLAAGMGVSWALALLAAVLAAWRHTTWPAQALLHGLRDERTDRKPRRIRAAGQVPGMAALVLLVGSLAVLVFTDSDQAVGAFFAAGAGLLAAGLLAVVGAARHAAGSMAAGRSLTSTRLVLRATTRRAGRNGLVAGLLACGAFLVLSVASMRDDPVARADRRDSGSGGFQLVAESTVPLLENLGSASGRRRLGLPAGDPWDRLDILPLRRRDGDDAGCLNLHRVQSPRIIGVDAGRLDELGAFVDRRHPNPWQRLLEAEAEEGDFIPALAGDSDTARWGLGLPVGRGERSDLLYHDDHGRILRVRLVGTLPVRQSVFHGSILVAEEHFTRLFPSEEGHRQFLVDAPAGAAESVRHELNRALDRYGFEAVPAVRLLREFHAVEATYLRVFLVLGGLGLVLGSTGLALAVYRNIIERRTEWALLTAVGFSRRQIRGLVLGEQVLVLVAGLAVGLPAAALAVWPAARAAATELPWVGMVLLVAAMVILGLGTAAWSARLALHAPLLPALRDE